MPKKSVKLRILLGGLIFLPGLGAWTLTIKNMFLTILYSKDPVFADIFLPFIVSIALFYLSAHYFYSAGKQSKK